MSDIFYSHTKTRTLSDNVYTLLFSSINLIINVS